MWGKWRGGGGDDVNCTLSAYICHRILLNEFHSLGDCGCAVAGSYIVVRKHVKKRHIGEYCCCFPESEV